MRAAVGLVAGLVVLTSLACGGGDGSGGSENDVEARANEIVLTYFEVFASKKPPEALVDLYAPECRRDTDTAQVTMLIELINAFVPQLAEADIEAVDLGDLDVEETSDGFQVSPTNPSGMRFRVDGRSVNAQEYLTDLIGADADSFSSVTGEGALTLVRREGRLYVGDCDALQEITG